MVPVVVNPRTLNFLATPTLVDQQQICMLFFGQLNRLALSGIKKAKCFIRRTSRRLDLQPAWRAFQPGEHSIGSVRMTEFLQYLGWDEDPGVQFGENIAVSNED